MIAGNYDLWLWQTVEKGTSLFKFVRFRPLRQITGNNDDIGPEFIDDLDQPVNDDANRAASGRAGRRTSA